MRHLALFDSIEAGHLAIAAARRRGYRITVFRGRAQARYAPTARALAAAGGVDEVVEVADLDEISGVMPAVSRVHADHPLTAILPLWDNSVPCSAAVAEKLGLVHPSPGAVRRCRQKRLAREALAQAGVPSARFARAASEGEALAGAARLGYPVYFKPATGSASLFAQPVASEGELLGVFRAFRSEAEKIGVFGGECLAAEALLEEVLVGTMTSAEVAVGHGRTWVMAVGERKRWSENDAVELGTSMPPATLAAADIRACAEYARQVVAALELTVGMYHIEIMVTACGPRMIETNPRVMGGNGPFLLSEYLREDVFDLLLDLHEGKDLGPRADCSGPGAVVSHVLASTRDSEAAHFDPAAALDAGELAPNLVSLRVNLKPGQRVKRVSSNFDYIGGFQMRGTTIAEATAKVTAFHSRLGERLGLPLAY